VVVRNAGIPARSRAAASEAPIANARNLRVISGAIVAGVARLSVTVGKGQEQTVNVVCVVGILVILASRLVIPAHAASAPGPLLVAFGDPVTWGANASDNTTNTYQSILPLSNHMPGPGDNTYPGDLGRTLQRTVYDYGYPGQTTQTDLPRLKNVLSQLQPKTILLMEGTPPNGAYAL